MSIKLPEGFRWRVSRDSDSWDVLWLRLQKQGRFGFWKTVHWKYVSIEDSLIGETTVQVLIELAKPEAWDAYTNRRSLIESVDDVVRQHKQLP